MSQSLTLQSPSISVQANGAPKPVGGKPYVHKQWVRQKTLHVGQDGSCWVRNIWVAPACRGKVELDLLKLGPRLSEKSIYSVYAVSGGSLGGPLPANKAGLPSEPEFKNSGYVWEEQN
ncbi:MAG: hypothetical protein IPK50_07770 [Fibrobacterota bacterium]|nr:hypothetical protein [Fibrobacterota bacterium]QQS06788.1 MAG: hypothetical protein IPK50_07770 [Fibrobacterota bacterium]